jgi:hypothetical protein
MRGFVAEMDELEKQGIGFLKGLGVVGRALGRGVMGAKGKTRGELFGQAWKRGKQVMQQHPGKSLGLASGVAGGAGLGAGYLAS